MEHDDPLALARAIAHEIRTPLAGISSAAQLLRFRATEDPVVERNVGRIMRETERLARIAAAPEDSEEGRLRQAMLDHPTFVSGTRRPELRFMTELPGVIAKSGAEALLVVGLPDATAIAVKIEDGADRPLYAVAGRAVQLAGWEAEVLTERPRVLGGGETVGAVHVTF